MWTVISGVFGGLLRLAPEVFKYFNQKTKMKHELEMQRLHFEYMKLQIAQVKETIIEKGAIDYSTKSLDALETAIEAQAKPSGVKWIDGFSALMRPLITFQWVILLYPGVIVATFVILVMNNVSVLDAMNKVFGESEKALVSFIVDFWFIGRVLETGRKRYDKLE